MEEFQYHITLEDRLSQLIKQWVSREMGLISSKNPNISKVIPKTLIEITVFNMLLIYSNTIMANEFRDFIFGKDDETIKNEDFTIDRIKNLYTMIKMTFPKNFIEGTAEAFEETIVELGYEVNGDIVKLIPYGWLLHQIQFSVIYNQSDNLLPLKENLAKPKSPHSSGTLPM